MTVFNRNITELQKKIRELAKKKKAVILSHYYQVPEIQDIADFVGDSLELAKRARQSDSDIILLCGVHFMAETAKILNPSKKVLIPSLEAGCSLSESCPPDKFKTFIEKISDRFVMVYINTTAEIKAMSDLVCTSSNALNLIKKVPEDKTLVFAPDKHLGNYLMRQSGRKMIIWEGTCVVHNEFERDLVLSLKREHPSAKIIVHPECSEYLIDIADFVGSTSKLLRYVAEDTALEYIVGTEAGIVHQMRKVAPNKQFYVAPTVATCSACQMCPYMKKNTLENAYETLLYEKNEIIIPEDILQKAYLPLKRMIEWS